MTNPPTIIPVKRRVRRKRREATAAAPPAPALMLVAATWDQDEQILVLTFSRAIDIAAIDGSQIVVNDPQATDNILAATGGAEQVSDTVLQLFMQSTGPASGSDVVLNAGAGNGIVAVDDGAAWAGVADLVLPFG